MAFYGILSKDNVRLRPALTSSSSSLTAMKDDTAGAISTSSGFVSASESNLFHLSTSLPVCDSLVSVPTRECVVYASKTSAPRPLEDPSLLPAQRFQREPEYWGFVLEKGFSLSLQELETCHETYGGHIPLEAEQRINTLVFSKRRKVDGNS